MAGYFSYGDICTEKENIRKVMRERTLLEFLKTYGVAAHTMLAYYQSADGRIFCQYPYVPGETSLDGYSYTDSGAMGEAIGLLHVALKSFGEPSGFPVKTTMLPPFLQFCGYLTLARITS